MSRLMTKPTNDCALSEHSVWSESLLCAQWEAKDPIFLHADSEDSDQTGRMPRLIWVFAGRTLILFVLSCRGSNEIHFNPIEKLLLGLTKQVYEAEFLGKSNNLWQNNPHCDRTYLALVTYEQYSDVNLQQIISWQNPFEKVPINF